MENQYSYHEDEVGHDEIESIGITGLALAVTSILIVACVILLLH